MSSHIALSFLVAAFAASSIAKEQPTPQEEEAAWLRQTGGMVQKPNSQKGRVVFLDVGNRVSDAEYESVFKSLRGAELGFAFSVVRRPNLDEFKGAAPFLAAKTSLKADVLVAAYEDAERPALCIAPFDGIAALNVGKFDASLMTDSAKRKFHDSRVRKGLLRAFASACNAAGTSFPGNVLSVPTIADLDHCREFLPADAIQRIIDSLKARGVTPSVYCTYRAACREGWAPQPTNDCQKAVWDKVRELPSEPIKIKFDPKQDAGK